MPFESEAGRDAEMCRVASADDSEIREEVWLLGQPSLTDFLDYVKKAVDGGGAIERRVLVDAWREANDHYYDLESLEAGIADTIECLDLPDPLDKLAQELTGREHFRNTFDRMPTTFGMVELDKIVVSQRHVTLPFVEALAAKLDPQAIPPICPGFASPSSAAIRRSRSDGWAASATSSRRTRTTCGSTRSLCCAPTRSPAARPTRQFRSRRPLRRLRLELPHGHSVGRQDGAQQRLSSRRRDARGRHHPCALRDPDRDPARRA